MRLLLALILAGLLHAGENTALDRYIAAPDDSYRYNVVNTLTLAGATLYTVDMVSQNWLTAAEVDRTEWRHWLMILKPPKVDTSTALLFIDGGSTSSSPPVPEVSLLALAISANAVVAQLKTVPNQPLRFAGEERTRTEDALIAYTWDKFLRTGDGRWPARLPMTKAAVRAMDTVTSVVAESGVKVGRFVIAGGSKRGWTAWTTATVDRRVAAILPLVIDTLNVQPNFAHHLRSYGAWAPAVQDYVDMGIMNWFGKPEMSALMEIEDPYEYRDRLTMPKYLVNSTGDQFFLPDSSRFYFDQLPGEKYLRYVPNTDHSLDDSDALEGALAWFRAFVTCTPRPRFYWRADRVKGSIRLRATDPPVRVRLWQATNPEKRDFRLSTIGRAWTETTVEAADGVYEAALPQPATGYTAFFLELTYDTGEKYTTEVVVTPDTYPFPDILQ